MSSPKLKKTKPSFSARGIAKPLRQAATQLPDSGVGAQRRAFWREEISYLSGQCFVSLEAALSQIADAVLDRLGAQRSRRESEKKFLIDLFITDKELCDDVRSILKIS